MSQPATSLIPAVTHRCLVKSGAGVATVNGAPVTTATADGFVDAPQLRCQRFTMERGAAVGHAIIDYVPTAGTLPSVESIDFSTDDIVRVVVQPVDHELLSVDLPEDLEGLVVFEGQMVRHSLKIDKTGEADDEGIDFTCYPTAVLDNLAPEHQITGRWILLPDRNTGIDTVQVIESYDMPAVFNFRGRPNMTTAAFRDAFGTELGISSEVFTSTGDGTGSYWTARKAIGSLLVKWLYGDAEDNILPRNVCLDPALAGVVTEGATITDPDYLGLDEILPETNVHGLGVLSAIDLVCRNAGYEMNITPHYGLAVASDEPDTPPAPDRLYVLKINRIGSGTARTVKIEKRGEANSGSLLKNNISRIRLLKDGTRVRNQVRVSGLSFIELAVPLRPLWEPADVTTDTTAAEYAARHVRGGADFQNYKHVGRLWGIDCTGEQAATGYTSSLYKHDPFGFDWVREFNLNLEGNALDDDRAAQGITDRVEWSTRTRQLLPLKRPELLGTGTQYIVEVTEDGGSTWVPVPLRVQTVRDRCGVILRDIKDLSKTNTQTLGDSGSAAVADSWWGLMFPEDDGDPQFQVRLTCCVIADHGAVALAPQLPNSGSDMTRQMLARFDGEEVWSVPGSTLNDTEAFRLIQPFADIERYEPISRAEQLRDANEPKRISAYAYSWRMDFYNWELGQRITRIEGRDLDMSVYQGDSERHPTIAKIQVDLSGTGEQAAANQGVRLDLTDSAILEAV